MQEEKRLSEATDTDDYKHITDSEAIIDSGQISNCGSSAADLSVSAEGEECGADMKGSETVPIVEIAEDFPEDEIHGDGESAEPASRLQGWERKLLDMSLRNSMLNLRPGKKIVPLMENDVMEIKRYFLKEDIASIIGIREKEGDKNIEEPQEEKKDIEEFAEKVTLRGRRKTKLKDREKENQDLQKGLYRAARTSMEENGANSLFIAVGSLKWYDRNDSKPHIAPLMFIPVNMIRKRALTYEVRTRDEDPTINTTLIEMLRQMFGVEFPELSFPLVDEDGFPEWSKVEEVFSPHIAKINEHQSEKCQWKISGKSYIGIFSFTKFLMWHDIHHNRSVVEQQPLLKALIKNRYDFEDSEDSVDAGELEATTDLMMPIDYDSSQLEAVAASGKGKSFVLHGPPGTGKSQTITNMIANAIYNGKRVLFVAEKKAALDVVKDRLDSIDLSPYCLELHSNKTDKKSFFGQLSSSRLNYIGRHTEIPEDVKYKDLKADLDRNQTELRMASEAIHRGREFGLSFYDYVCGYFKNGPHDLSFRHEEISDIAPGKIDKLSNELESLDYVAEIIGKHPSESDFLGVIPKENSGNNQGELTETVSRLRESVVYAKKKAQTLMNRWIFKRSPEEIFLRDPSWLRMQTLATVEGMDLTDIDVIGKKVNRWNRSLDQLQNWYLFSEKEKAIRDYNIPQALDYYLAGRSGKETAEAVKSGYYKSFANRLMDNDPSLREFHGMLYDIKIRLYKKQVSFLNDLRLKVLSAGMRKAIMSVEKTEELMEQKGILMKRMLNNGRGVSLRKVVTESFGLLSDVFPCMLMSPLSVAKYLDMKPGLFDLVIFDEASQLGTPDAVGAIARSGSVVVVGDPKQLPPTRFFTSQNSRGEEMEESEDADSILEDCIALGMPSKYLSRHYRSHHESLITFSNVSFYDNKLLTFPSSNDSERKVSFVDPEGVYDIGKTRTNPVEAEAVVDYVIDLYETTRTPQSIGIVAFSKQQSNLIEDILNLKLQKKRAVQKLIDDGAEPLFVKNLENVQGDERNIIIFSIGYGPDKRGRVSLNFGPLNKRGGERRLNVAVTRARDEMVVFSSLLPVHIPTEGVAPRGVVALREFLSYAIKGRVSDRKFAEESEESVVKDISRRLLAKGYDVDTRVGRSAFKVDIAIKDKKNPDKYKMGIILDGRDYHSLPTVRDREITIPGVLRSLGWRIGRVWTIDWYRNPDSAFEKLMTHVHAICD